MLDILDVINEATKEANSFENHAAKELALEERLLYLQGLALVMNADGEIHPEEKEYIRILIKSFDMDETILESFVEFAEQPDKDTIQAFFRAFRRRPIAQLFLFDALMMTRRDDKIDEREKAVVDKIAEQLEVLKGTYQDIYDLFCHIKNKDWDESALYFSSHLLNPEHFKHLLDYFEVDFDELLKRNEATRKDRLLRHLKHKLEHSLLDHSKFTKLKINNNIILPFLQSGIDKGEIVILNEVIKLPNDKEVHLNQVGLKYYRETKSLSIAIELTLSNRDILDYFGEILNLNDFEAFSMFWKCDDETVVGKIDKDEPRILHLSKPYKKGLYIVIKGYLWKYKDSSNYNIFDQRDLFSSTKSNFQNIDQKDNFILHYSISDTDSKGGLQRVKLF